MRRNPDGQADPSGSIASEASRGFTGHEHLEAVGLIHMNGRVYDPLLGRFGTPDPMTEDPFSTQGWNRYAYVGNSPLNFTDPSGYCFLGCFWKPLFKAIGNFFKQAWRSIVQMAVTTACLVATSGMGGPLCAGAGGFVAGLTSGDLGLAIRGAITAIVTAGAFKAVGDLTGNFAGADPIYGGHGPLEAGSDAHLFNIAGHALVGCASAVMNSGKCGPGALSGAMGSAVGPFMKDLSFGARLVTNAVIGGTVSAAAGGNFGNGAVTAAFGYLFNEVALACRPAASSHSPLQHCGLFVFERLLGVNIVRGQFSLGGGATEFNTNQDVFAEDYQAFRGGNYHLIEPPDGMSQKAFDDAVIRLATGYRAPWYDAYVMGPNSNSAAAWPLIVLGAQVPSIPDAPHLHYWSNPSKVNPAMPPGL